MNHWPAIQNQITLATGSEFHILSKEMVNGGSINQAYKLVSERENYFVKLNSAAMADMFDAEMEGLKEIITSNTIRAPKPVCCGIDGDIAYLVLEHFETGRGHSNSAILLGHQLAAMHKKSHQQFGWHRNNTIGSTTQINKPEESWATFWIENRLRFQLDLARQKSSSSYLYQYGEKLLDKLPAFFFTYQVSPSLLHGDLWSGNYAICSDGEPIIFDPAVYYGDREADLAMTELFGGFPSNFYQAYDEVFPVDDGYPVRKTLYNLYHVLNHFNLFGGGYLSQAQNMIDRLLLELT